MCVESAAKVYERLLLRTPEKDILDFETIAILAKDADGIVDENQVKELIKIFRPDRDGKLTLVEFVKSIDNVYKGEQNCLLLIRVEFAEYYLT
jgi:hypothetical protein